jgi:hypothetical protein
MLILGLSLLVVLGLKDIQPWLAGGVGTGVLVAGTLPFGVVRQNEKAFMLGMIISHKHGFVFVQIQKCGGESVTDAL